MTEYPQHRKAKQRVFELLCKNPEFTEISMERQMPFGIRGFNFVADVYCEMKMTKLVGSFNPMRFTVVVPLNIEIDGKHHPARKNKERDSAFESHGIKTIRFDTSSIVGKKAVDDKTILAEIAFHLKPREKLTC